MGKTRFFQETVFFCIQRITFGIIRENNDG